MTSLTHMEDAMTSDITLSDTPKGYVRSDSLQASFEEAAKRLLELDGPRTTLQPPSLVADLALEGGGVKGLGLVGAVVVLDEAGYVFRGVAGTSAGAIAAVLVAGLAKAGRPMSDLRTLIASLDFKNFMPSGKLRDSLHVLGKKRGDAVADLASLIRRDGIYSGDYLVEWLTPILHDQLGVRTFADLRLDKDVDPGMSLYAEREYSVVMHASDISRGQLVRLPWDYPYYALAPDDQDPVAAVRASMSIPFFFDPVHVQSEEVRLKAPRAGGGVTEVHYAAGTQTWVDGGLLENFPIRAFDRVDGQAPRWPTIGIKLSSFQTEFPPMVACDSSDAVARHIEKMLTGEWNSHAIDESTAARTIFVDNLGLKATDFDLTRAQQDQLFLNGVEAATTFVISCAASGGVPLR
ncbi:MAG: patatin-like phospholipase family protein [Acidimicrobiales bacterium]|jgi:NTE family protein